MGLFGRPFATLLVGTSALLSLGCSQPLEADELTGNLTQVHYLPSSPELLELGKAAYEAKCLVCHGRNGDSRGEAFDLLIPKPRDFVKAYYRLVSTWDSIPTDEDLFRTISRGMPGSAMPPWGHLSEQVRWALVHYIKTFSQFPLEIGADHQPQNEDDIPSGHIVIPPEVPYDREAQDRARYLFLEVCAGCHGESGRGDGADADEQMDTEGFPARPRNLNAGIFKGRPDHESLYKRISAGLPGSPMPSHSYLYGDDLWHLVHHVLSLSTEEQRTRVEKYRSRIVAQRVEVLPDGPEADIWETAPAASVNLIPLLWQNERPEEVVVQALHDRRDIVIKMSWSDPSHNHTSSNFLDSSDAAVMKITTDPDPPFFGLGHFDGSLNVWISNSSGNLDLPFQEVAQESPVPDQHVQVTSSFSDTSHQVVFKRPLKADSKKQISLPMGEIILVSFAVWDRAAGEEGEKKAVTVWQELLVPSTGLWDWIASML
jgi:DMSO reductase family type II enzyme heme b subunit